MTDVKLALDRVEVFVVRRRLPFFRATALTLWATAAIAGSVVLAVHASTAGESASAPATRPITAKPLLQVFLHPKCPCSSATVEELARLTGRCGDRLAIEAIVFQPETKADDWADTAIVQSVTAIPGVTVRPDPGAVLMHQSGVKTSGQALLYGADGRLLFNGGLTASRGHAGDNAGVDAIIDQIFAGTSATKQTPVFGCGIEAASSSVQAVK